MVTWGGGFPNDKYSVGSNWFGGVAPANGDTLLFNDNSDSALNIDVAGVSIAGITVVSSSSTGGANIDIFGANALTIGSGGVTASSDDGPYDSSQITFDVPVILSANQTWGHNSNPYGSIQVNGAITGAFSLTFTGDGETPATFTLNSSASTFSGGLTLSGQFVSLIVGSSSAGPAGAPTSGPVGTGTLTLGDGTTLTSGGGGPVTLANPISAGDNTNGAGITFGGPAGFNNGGSTQMTLSGPVTMNDADIEFDMGQNSAVTFSGNLNGYTAGVCLDFGSGNGGEAGNGYAILQGTITNVNRLDLEDNVSVILDGPGPSQISTLEDIGFEGSSTTTYLGMGSGYAGSVAGLLTFVYEPGFQGTLGFDTISGPTTTFPDNIDLTNFQSEGGSFVGLGSATSAILTGTITPPGGLSGMNYPFGGGGGTLTVDSSLSDGYGDGPVPRSLTLSQGNAPLTLILSGELTYSGSTYINGGALIFNTPVPSSGQINLNSGYVGVTADAGFAGSEQNFINLLSSIPETAGVIGFDSLTGQYVVTSPLNMAGLGTGVYLGTATSVNYMGTIVPNSNIYQFAGVKGGQVTVSTSLNDGDGPYAVAVGLPYPVESFNPVTGTMSQSTVTLAGANFYSGGTTLNSGYLDVTNYNSLGSGPLYVPDSPVGGGGWVATLAASGGPVTLPNNIYVPNGGLALNTGSSNLLTLTGTIGNFINGDSTDVGQLGIFGPVDIEADNSYSGGTTINTGGATVTVGADTGLGTGPVYASNSVLNFTSANPILGSPEGTQSQQVQLSGTTATFSGYPSIYAMLLQGSTVNFNGTGAYVAGLDDPPNSGSVINLGAGTQLTIDLNSPGGNGSTFHGDITGSYGSLSVINSSDGGNESLDLRGANTYGGGTTIAPNALIIASNNSALGTGAVNILAGGGLVVNTGVTVTNPINLTDGGGLAGFGTFAPGGSLTIQNGSIIDPGRGGIGHGSGDSQVPFPGTLTFGGGTSLTFGGAGNFLFSITDANGTAGSGYGTLSLGTGSLNITATPGSPFQIDLYSYDASAAAAGQAANFNSGLPFTWTIVTAASITNFNASDFTFNLSNFQNPIGAGMFYVSENVGDTSLMLNFTPVPEPSTWALMASGLFAVGAAVRRRRR